MTNKAWINALWWNKDPEEMLRWIKKLDEENDKLKEANSELIKNRQMYYDALKVEVQRRLEANFKDSNDRTGEHYGFYGTACMNTGQFDAGECWKCEIKRLRKERDNLKEAVHNAIITATGLKEESIPPSSQESEMYNTPSARTFKYTKAGE